MTEGMFFAHGRFFIYLRELARLFFVVIALTLLWQ